MKFDWQQLSPGEREVLLRHFLLKRKDAPVTPEKVCAALEKTHCMSWHKSADGKAVVRFSTTKNDGVPSVSLADDLTDGIFKAALRARGVQVEDGMNAALMQYAGQGARAGR